MGENKGSRIGRWRTGVWGKKGSRIGGRGNRGKWENKELELKDGEEGYGGK